MACNGLEASRRATSVSKYSLKSFSLTINFAAPGYTQTRATQLLRRPTPWAIGACFVFEVVSLVAFTLAIASDDLFLFSYGAYMAPQFSYFSMIQGKNLLL